ncbi:hypothetical protein ACIN5162_2087 [Acinetobacter baumannii OIFC0162]|nr:hypothetical protein ACIN5162_2087 [Acinetobacter baumannii OIFC0162]EKU58217.1 hypothetical protein ACINWC348_A0017 [Acinetobacter baumannii WC-348]
MKLSSIILILFCLSSTCLYAEKLGKEKIEAYIKMIENYRTAEQNLQNYLSGIHY